MQVSFKEEQNNFKQWEYLNKKKCSHLSALCYFVFQDSTANKIHQGDI